MKLEKAVCLSKTSGNGRTGQKLQNENTRLRHRNSRSFLELAELKGSYEMKSSFPAIKLP
jgi:hypothetical protein